MFKCKICEEKELRISELKEQIQYFKNVLNPPQRIQKYELEQDAVLGNSGEELDPASIIAEEIENDKIQKESDFIFSGNDEQVEQ